MKKIGETISEQEMIQRIHEAVQSIIESDVDGTIKLHNLVCKGEVAVFEHKNGNPLDEDGCILGDVESDAWGYIFTKGE